MSASEGTRAKFYSGAARELLHGYVSAVFVESESGWGGLMNQSWLLLVSFCSATATMESLTLKAHTLLRHGSRLKERSEDACTPQIRCRIEQAAPTPGIQGWCSKEGGEEGSRGKGWSSTTSLDCSSAPQASRRPVEPKAPGPAVLAAAAAAAAAAAPSSS